jgi:HPt (histidine-containing phosphotransfer) domain-containing protein
VDFVKARALMDNNKELFEEIVRLFLVDGIKHLNAAKQALAAGDNELLKHHAHTIKGMVGIFAAERTTNAAATVENLAGLAGTEQAMSVLETELLLLHEALKSYQWH